MSYLSVVLLRIRKQERRLQLGCDLLVYGTTEQSLSWNIAPGSVWRCCGLPLKSDPDQSGSVVSMLPAGWSGNLGLSVSRWRYFLVLYSSQSRSWGEGVLEVLYNVLIPSTNSLVSCLCLFTFVQSNSGRIISVLWSTETERSGGFVLLWTIWWIGVDAA